MQESLGILPPKSAFSGRWRHHSKRSSLSLFPIFALRQRAHALQPVLPAFGQAVNCRRWDSATAMNASAIGGARDMLPLYSRTGIYQAKTRWRGLLMCFA
jgi:hypothetical protein